MGVIDGHFTLRVFEDDQLVAVGEGDNLMCTSGYGALVQALLWSASVDQNANAGLLLIPSYLFPVYGAIGSGSTTPAIADVQLTSETARGVVYTGSASTTSFTMNFFYGTTGSWTAAEAGVFLQATATANSGFLLDHALISPTVTKTTGQTATLSVTITFS